MGTRDWRSAELERLDVWNAASTATTTGMAIDDPEGHEYLFHGTRWDTIRVRIDVLNRAPSPVFGTTATPWSRRVK